MIFHNFPAWQRREGRRFGPPDAPAEPVPVVLVRQSTGPGERAMPGASPIMEATYRLSSVTTQAIQVVPAALYDTAWIACSDPDALSRLRVLVAQVGAAGLVSVPASVDRMTFAGTQRQSPWWTVLQLPYGAWPLLVWFAPAAGDPTPSHPVQVRVTLLALGRRLADWSMATRVREEVIGGLPTFSNQFFDSFTGRTIPDIAGPVDTGQLWTSIASTHADLSGNEYRWVGGVGQGDARYNSGATDGSVRCRIRQPTTGPAVQGFRLRLRWSDSNNSYYFGVNSGPGGAAVYALEKVVAGVFTRIADVYQAGGITLMAPATGDVIEARLKGSMVYCLVNGGLALAVSDTSLTAGTSWGVNFGAQGAAVDDVEIRW